MDVRRVITEIDGFLSGRGHRWALAGALALHAYGYGRATADVDLVTEAAAQPGLLEHLEGLGYHTLHSSEGYSHHAHPRAQWGRVDVIYVSGPTAERLFGEARRIEGLLAHPVRVPSPEHLAAMKALAIRNDPSRKLREMADIGFLLGLPGVDRQRVRRFFAGYGLEGVWRDIEAALNSG